MSKRKKRPLSLGMAVVMSLLTAFVMGVLIFTVTWFIPNNPVRDWFDLVYYNNSSTISTNSIYLSLMSQIDTLEMFVASPLSMLAGGIALGIIMGEEYGEANLYRWAAACGAFINFLSIGFVWGNKLLSQGMHLMPGDINAKFLSAQLLALVFWIGAYVIGSMIGRRFHKQRVAPATA